MGIVVRCARLAHRPTLSCAFTHSHTLACSVAFVDLGSPAIAFEHLAATACLLCKRCARPFFAVTATPGPSRPYIFVISTRYLTFLSSHLVANCGSVRRMAAHFSVASTIDADFPDWPFLTPIDGIYTRSRELHLFSAINFSKLARPIVPGMGLAYLLLPSGRDSRPIDKNVRRSVLQQTQHR